MNLREQDWKFSKIKLSPVQPLAAHQTCKLDIKIVSGSGHIFSLWTTCLLFYCLPVYSSTFEFSTDFLISICLVFSLSWLFFLSWLFLIFLNFLSIRLPAFLLVYFCNCLVFLLFFQSTYLPGSSLSTYLLNQLPTCVLAYLFIYLSTELVVYLSSYLLKCLSTWFFIIYLSTELVAYLSTCVSIYLLIY